MTPTEDPVPPSFTLQVAVTGTGTVTSESEGIDTASGDDSVSAREGAKITLIADAGHDHEFDAWGGDCASLEGGTCTVTMDADKEVDATFSRLPPSPAPSLRPLDAIGCAGVARGDTCMLHVGWTATPEPYRGLEFEMTSDAFALLDATLGNDAPAGCWIASGPAKVVMACDAQQGGGGTVADLLIERIGPIPASVAVTDAAMAIDVDTLRAVPGGSLVVGETP